MEVIREPARSVEVKEGAMQLGKQSTFTPAQKSAAMSPEQARQMELLRQSTLTPGAYKPTPAMRADSHVVLAIGREPLILLGPDNDYESNQIAQRLSASAEMASMVNTIYPEWTGPLNVRIHHGNTLTWRTKMTALVQKSAGKVELGNENGSLIAVILDAHQPRAAALAIAMATNNKVLHCIDLTAPQIAANHVPGSGSKPAPKREEPEQGALTEKQLEEKAIYASSLGDSFVISIAWTQTSSQAQQDALWGVEIDRKKVSAEELKRIACVFGTITPSATCRDQSESIYFYNVCECANDKFANNGRSYSLHIIQVNGQEPKSKDYQKIADLIGTEFENSVNLDKSKQRDIDDGSELCG